MGFEFSNQLISLAESVALIPSPSLKTAPFSSVSDSSWTPYRPPDAERIEAFRKALVEKGQRTFVRYSRGQDVMAACGQLALVESAAPENSKTAMKLTVSEPDGYHRAR